MLFDSEQNHGQSHVQERRRRHGLHAECGGCNSRSSSCCTKKTLVAVAAAALMCLSSLSPVVFASPRHLLPSRKLQAGNSFRFASSQPPLNNTLPSTATVDDEQPPLNNTLPSTATVDDETRVTTTSFFRLRPETISPKKLDGISDTSTPSETLELPSPTLAKPSQAQIQRNFAVCLMGISGCVEGICSRRFGCFPNLMTGTIIKLAEAVGNLNFSVASIQVSMIVSYMGGGFIFSKWKKQHLQSEEALKISKHEQHKSSLVAVSMLSGMFMLLSDILGGIPIMRSLKLPLLAVAYGIINAGTVDVGTGVTHAMTGHVTKIGQGLATGGFTLKDPSKPSAHRTSAQGLAFFWLAALVANLAYGVLEKGAFPKMQMMAKLPLGTTIAAVYACLFRWYAKESASAAEKTL